MSYMYVTYLTQNGNNNKKKKKKNTKYIIDIILS